MLAIEGAVVTIYGIGCRRDIAHNLVDEKADYLRALKLNQGFVAPGRRTVRRRTECQDFLRHNRQPRRQPSMAITAASEPAPQGVQE